MLAPHGASRLALALTPALLLSLPSGAGTIEYRPDALGPWQVGHTSFDAVDAAREDRPLAVEAWYPVDAKDAVGELAFYGLGVPGVGLMSDVAYAEPPVSSGRPFPLVLFSHGSGGIALQSTVLMETLASHGFVVVSPNHTGNTTLDGTDPIDKVLRDRPRDLSFLIDVLIARNADPKDFFAGAIDADRIGVAGHSLGGYTAFAMAAGWEKDPADARVDVIAPISGSTKFFDDAQLAAISVPTLFVGGTLDVSVPIETETVRGFTLIQEPEVTYRADVIGASHTHFANICDIGEALIAAGVPMEDWKTAGGGILRALIEPYNDTCSKGVFPLDEAQRLQSLYVVSVFRRHLYDDTSVDPFLTESYAEKFEPNVNYFVPEPNAALAPCAAAAALWLLSALRSPRSARARHAHPR